MFKSFDKDNPFMRNMQGTNLELIDEVLHIEACEHLYQRELNEFDRRRLAMVVDYIKSMRSRVLAAGPDIEAQNRLRDEIDDLRKAWDAINGD